MKTRRVSCPPAAPSAPWLPLQTLCTTSHILPWTCSELRAARSPLCSTLAHVQPRWDKLVRTRISATFLYRQHAHPSGLGVSHHFCQGLILKSFSLNLLLPPDCSFFLKWCSFQLPVYHYQMALLWNSMCTRDFPPHAAKTAGQAEMAA